MQDGELRWWQIGLIASVSASLLAFFLQFALLLFFNHKKQRNFPIFDVYLCMHQYGARAGCAIIAICQIIFVAYAITMHLHIFDRPLYGMAPPVFGLFAAIVGMSLNLHCAIRWMFGWLLIGLIIVDITGAAQVESDIHCLEDSLCDVDSLPPASWLWFNFIVRNISLAANVYSILVSSFITWEMGCCWLQNDAENCCYRCDRYPLTAWEPMYDSRTIAEAVFDTKLASELREGARKRVVAQISNLKTLARSSTFGRAAANTRILQSRATSVDASNHEMV